MSPQTFKALPGSGRHALPGAQLIHNCHPDQVIQVSVRLRPRSGSKYQELRTTLEKGEFQPVSRTEFAAMHGADPADLEKIRKFAQQFHLKVRENGTELARRTVVLEGTVADMQKAFNVELKEYSHPEGNFRGRVGTIGIPVEYADVITGVFGLDNRPQAQAHFRRLETKPGIRAHAVTSAHNPNDVAQLYDYPKADGAGQCIGLIELGGGFQLSDIQTYFTSLKLPVPQVISVSVDGGTNSPGDPNGPDGEVMLDIEVAGAVAPAAKIVVYFAPNTDQGFLDAITTAVHDTSNNPSVISISWGSAEAEWTQQATTNFDEAFQSAAAMGVSVCVASGDNGSTDGVSDGQNHVDFPASSPFALGCGGTSLQTSNGQISKETVWNDGANGGATGGGVSNVFALPTYQQGFNVPAPTVKTGGRGVPDVSGDADPNTGYNVLVDGEQAVIGGTSAVAPLWAGLIALMNQQLGKPVGYLHPQIYKQAVEASFRDITQGTNGAFKAAKGWDACTGLGSPDGAKLLETLQQSVGQNSTEPGRTKSVA
jgi:kumamolisin